MILIVMTRPPIVSDWREFKRGGENRLRIP